MLLTAGIAALCLAIVGWMVDIKHWQRFIRPYLVFGTNPILAYVGGELLASILRSSIKWKVDGDRIGTGLTMVRGLEALRISSNVASLLWALTFVLICYALLTPLYRRKIFLRV